MKIRQVRLHDLEACFLLEQACFPEEEAASKQNIETRIRQFPEGFYVMEDDNGHIIGHINSGCTNKTDITDEAFKGLVGHEPDGSNMVIFSVAIDPNQRGQKLGHKLLAHFEKESLKLQKDCILLLCKTELIGYYEQAGYTYRALSSSTHGGAQWHEMIKNLPPSKGQNVSKVEITPALPEDFDTIQELAHAIWPPTFGTILSPEQITYMLDMMYSLTSLKSQFEQGHRFLLLKFDGKFVGYAGYEIHYLGQAITKVHKIYLSPDVQGKGLGKLLLNQMAALAMEAGDQTLALNVNRYNPAKSFYEHYGFQVKATDDIDIGNGFLMEDYVMHKPL